MTRQFVRTGALVFALHAAACARLTAPWPESRFPVQVDGHPELQVNVVASPLTARQARHWVDGSRLAIARHVRILGRVPAPAITVVDRATESGAATEPGTIAVRAPFLTTDRGRLIEAAIAREVALAFWRSALRCDDSDGAFIEGLARFTAIDTLAAQYNGLLVPPAIGLYEQRWIGGLFPWLVRIERPAWTVPARRGDARTMGVERTALAMQTLANWLGTPTFEAALRAFAAGPRGGCVSWRDLQAAADAVSGLDLSWFFEPAFGARRTFDYGIESIDTVPRSPAGRGYTTRVVARRYGDAMFTGTSAPPVAPFEAGRGVEMRVRFADGREVVDYWDGRAERRTFDYDSPSAAMSATIDPRGVIQLDVDRTNNGRTLASNARTAALKWSTMWMAWLENALLTYSSLV